MMNNMTSKVMQNNPILAMIQTMRNGGNPMSLMQQMAQKDQRVAQAVKMMNGKSPAQLETMVRNMCKERNVSVEQVAQQLGIPMPQGK